MRVDCRQWKPYAEAKCRWGNHQPEHNKSHNTTTSISILTFDTIYKETSGFTTNLIIDHPFRKSPIGRLVSNNFDPANVPDLSRPNIRDDRPPTSPTCPMAAPSSPSKMVSSTNLSLSNSSPWRLKVTVEAEPDNDMFLDLAAEESLTNQIRKPKASRSRLVSKPVSKPEIPPRKAREDTAMSEDSLGLDNISGIFAADPTPARPPVTPKRPLSEVSKTLNTVIVPLKGSEPKQKPPKRKATPARKKAKEVDLSILESEIAQPSTTTTPKRGRGRPRKSINNLAEVAAGVVRRGNGSRKDVQGDNIHQTLGRNGMLSELPLDDQNDLSIMASEGFSMIAPRHTTSIEAPVGLTTPRPTPEIEDHHVEESTPFLEPSVEPRPRQDEGPIATSSLHTTAVEEEAVEDGVTEETASLSLKPGSRRRRSLRLSSKPTVNALAEPPARSSKVIERFRELTNNATKANEASLPGPRDEASSFRRFLQTEPDKIVPGTYEESTVYFAHKKPAQSIDRRRQTPAKKSRSGIIEPAEEGGGFGNILPEHLLPPAKSAGKKRVEIKKSTPNIRAAVAAPPPPKEVLVARPVTSDAFDDEGRSVRWHEDVVGGSFSLNSSSMERPEPDAPQQESTHRLLENEIIVEPFRPHAGRLNDGTHMPLVVSRSWSNHYWAVLTNLMYPNTKLVKRSKRSMAKLHPEESAEEAMERRRRILETFPRNNEGHLVLSEQDSNIIDAFEEHMRREILGEKQVAGEARPSEVKSPALRDLGTPKSGPRISYIGGFSWVIPNSNSSGFHGARTSAIEPWMEKCPSTSKLVYRAANDPEVDLRTGPMDAYDGIKPRQALYTTTIGLPRRHSFSSPERSNPVTKRKRTYLQSCDPDSESRYPFSRIKIARKASHPAKMHTPGQRVKLLDLPSELLANIIVFVIESPPPGEQTFLSKTAFAQGSVRRWTLDTIPHRDDSIFDIVAILNMDNHNNRYETPQNKDEAFYPSRMLNSLASTCQKLRKFVRLKEWDARFWRPAARLYYHLTYYPKVLPDSLDLIQGFLPINQTSWRNFLTCTIHYVDTRRRGVESFGTKAGCNPAITWKDYQAELSRSHESSYRHRSLIMLCRQPGPDLFDISWDAATERYTIAMGLNGGELYASVDKSGVFTRGEALRSDLIRSRRGLFPADVLEVKNDRFGIVKIGTSRLSSVTGPSSSQSSRLDRTFQDVLRWDLSCVPEVLGDEKARIARCASWGEYLCFTLFKQNFADPTAPFLDPEEDSMVYCIKATSGADSINPHTYVGNYRSELLWCHDFKMAPEKTKDGRTLEPAVCQIALSKSYAAILLRWNSNSVIKRIVNDKRQLYVIDLRTQDVVRCFNLPAFEWDFRHTDMGEEYKQIRLEKLTALYDDTKAVHRGTRVHDDKLTLLEYDSHENPEHPPAKIITGSHDYCNWVWNLDQESDREPFIVLDDFYWDTDTNGQSGQKQALKGTKWNKFKERAGWWCSTPNQVLDFWHDFSITPDGRFFAAIRAGRTFIWDLNEKRPTIRGYTSELEDEGIASSSRGSYRPDKSLEHYLGRPTEACDHRHGHAFLRWFEYRNRVPEQGLWMVFDDWSVVYLDRNDILEACGLPHREWLFSEDDFKAIDSSIPTAGLVTVDDGEEDEDIEG
ncbi:uncharacterized protein DFL_000916 [Arthrobotrys flagrans]|uniref:Uncharacterized protein n=1 Tax=Arthrobotrys flagrans TaxID=97331 RepID=A0A437AFM9_ARTFL|nr:hypothetical protein DFL_000916 [Arthrobotrys flagrans]